MFCFIYFLVCGVSDVLTMSNRVKFSGITTTSVDSTLACETVDGESRCTTTDPGYTWSASIANVTWAKST